MLLAQIQQQDQHQFGPVRSIPEEIGTAEIKFREESQHLRSYAQ